MKKIFAVSAVLLSSLVPAFADEAPIGQQIVDALNKVYGVHPGFRANHAKGIVVEGTFKGSPDASRLSKASIFDGSAIPVTIRFSDAGGVPNVADGSKGLPHGMAIKYHLKDGSETDMVLVSLKFFPVSDGAGFRDLLLATAASPPNAPKPTKLDAFLAAHPAAPAALASTSTPDSFADEEYYGIDAFIFVDKDGKKQPVRYMMQPEKLVHLDPADAAKKAPDFLVDELPARLAKGPVTFHLQAQLAAPGDQTRDPSKPWPADRKVVELGTLTIDKVDPDSLAAQKKLLFLPGALAPGIEQSDDPLIDVRDGAYVVSFGRRNP
ncbi:MAG TPA: catalase family peroxidase [Methylovirgula sp.]|nr:catalase family peroxidase [Methylovirgula sp.]